MKIILLAFYFVLFFNISGFAQVTEYILLANYETVFPNDYAPNDGIKEIIDNPWPEALNSSAKVLQYTKPEGTYKLYGLTVPFIPANQIKKVEFLMYGNIQGMFIQIKTSTEENIDVSWNNALNLTGWNAFTFNVDLSSRTDSITNFHIFPDMDLGGAGNPSDVYLIDDIQFQIEVPGDTPLTSISLPETIEMILGETQLLTPVFSPENAGNKTVFWSTLEPEIVTVDNAGWVTAQAIGTGRIVVNAEDGDKKDTCAVTVIDRPELPVQSYEWKTVRIGGGGAVPTIQAHPLVQNLYFLTTDVGTPYRWNHSLQRWEGMFYNTPADDWEKRGAASRLAIDPNDEEGNTLYATTGGAWSINGTVLKTTDRGNTWSDCEILLDVKPNNEQDAGQMIAVDPLNSQVVWVTTRSSQSVTETHGTFMSNKAGEPGSWSKVNDLYGSFIQFDQSSGTILRGELNVTRNILLGCTDGIYLSSDGGETFELMSGSPQNPKRASMHSDGTLYITTASGFFKWNGSEWSNITPPTSGGYRAVAVNPNNSNQVVVGSFSFSPYVFNHYRSNDGGSSWTLMKKVHDKSEAPWFETTLGQATREFCWDPFDQNMVWMTDYFCAAQTTNIWADPADIIWKSRVAGHEETVNIGNLLSPPSGPNLLHSSLADVGGWDHKSLTSPPEIGMQLFFPWTPTTEWGNLTGSALQESNPDFIVRVGRSGWEGPGYSGFTDDGGASYTLFNVPEGVAGGRVAVSATKETIIWVPQLGAPHRSVDRGATWQQITSLPSSGILGGTNVFASGPVFPLAADKVNGDKFYLYNNAGGMFVSTDGGETFLLQGAGLPSSWITNKLSVETTPGVEGSVWVGSIEFGLYHSVNSGASFQKINHVQSANFIAMGKELTDTPALYVFGTVNEIENTLFRSDDNGENWTNLGTPLLGRDPLAMTADRRVYGRVFFGTGGNGYFVGINEGSDTQAPTAPTDLDSLDVTETSFNLTWSASVDNIGIAGYDVFLNGVLKLQTESTSCDLTGLACNTLWSVTVRARDNAGNVSGESVPLKLSTLTCKSIQSFILVNAITQSNILTINDNTVIDLGDLPTRQLNIRAKTTPGTVGSVVFELTGAEIHSYIGNAAPYALFGITEGLYNNWSPAVGTYQLTATPYTSPDGTGREGTSLTRSFTITGISGIDPPLNMESRLTVSPNPTTGEHVNVQLAGYGNEKNILLLITDLTGREVFMRELERTDQSEQHIGISLPGLSAGLYLMTVITPHVKRSVKVMIR